jgi:3D (Asp-Asp-Asp) domain-containing protein
MSYSKNKKKAHFVAYMLLFIIGLSIGSLMISGIIHIFCCRCDHNHERLTPSAVAKAIEELETTSESKTQIEEPIQQTVNLGKYKLTAYCACVKCCGKTDGITASGVRATEGVTIAADTTRPFGTKVLIDGHEYTVQDRGGAIKGNRIDIYFDSHQDALEFGVQHKEIFIMKEGEII